jgi:hypothetical protein
MVREKPDRLRSKLWVDGLHALSLDREDVERKEIVSP